MAFYFHILTTMHGQNHIKSGYTMFRGSVKSTGYPLHSPVSPSLPHPCVTACHHVSTGLYRLWAVPVFPNTSARSPDTFFVVSFIASRQMPES